MDYVLPSPSRFPKSTKGETTSVPIYLPAAEDTESGDTFPVPLHLNNPPSPNPALVFQKAVLQWLKQHGHSQGNQGRGEADALMV